MEWNYRRASLPARLCAIDVSLLHQSQLPELIGGLFS